MIVTTRAVLSHRGATSRARKNHQNQRHLLAAASIAAIVLSGCGGSGGSDSASSTNSSQAVKDDTSFRSFISESPEVRAVIAAMPPETRPIDTKSTALALNPRAAVENATAAAAAEQAAAPSASASAAGIATASGGMPDFVDTMISDMRELNDHPLKDVNPVYGFSRGPGYVINGINSGGSNFMLPWFVQFEGAGNGASNTRVQFRNLRVFVKSRSTGAWATLSDKDTFDGIQCDQGGNYYECPEAARVEADDDQSVSTLPLHGRNLHGWWGAREPIQGWDVGAVVVTLQARLTVNGGSGYDDRDKAKYLIHVGADYYPDNAPPQQILPPVGISRSKLVTNDWQTFTMATLNDVGFQEPGGGISSDEMRANPPPMEP